MAPKPLVPTQTTKGKTGDDLETATISQQAEQADYKDSALPTGTEIDLQDQSVQDNELLSSDAVRLGETPQIDAAEKVIATEQRTQSMRLLHILLKQPPTTLVKLKLL